MKRFKSNEILHATSNGSLVRGDYLQSNIYLGGVMMTQNQIAYWNLQENQRSHRANESISSRQASAAEEQARAATTNARTNISKLAIDQQNANTNSRNADVNQRNSTLRERELGETQRHNTTVEKETMRNNKVENTLGAIRAGADVAGKVLSLVKLF